MLPTAWKQGPRSGAARKRGAAIGAATGGVFGLPILVAVLCTGLAAVPTADAQELRMLAREGLVREAADPNGATLATVPAGTPLRLVREVPPWYLVELPAGDGKPARQGYVSFSDAEWVADCDPQAAQQLAPGDVFQDCDIAPEMVVVPAGSFMMGSPQSEARRREHESLPRQVTIPKPFAVGKFEITFDEMEACERMGGCDGVVTDDESFGHGRRPVLNARWRDARRYVEWLAEVTGKPYRLLAEAEWEYAARAGSDGTRYWEDEADYCKYMNGYDESGYEFHGFVFYFVDPIPCDDGYAGTAPVGSFLPNAFGLYDMMGNADELTQDCYNTDFSDGPVDGSAWETGLCIMRMVRGGSWFHGLARNRLASRERMPMGLATSTSGFRVARDLE